ncbi:MAG: carboxypeptidase-like regulatory domain-containing protein [Acidobacteriota bacterium]
MQRFSRSCLRAVLLLSSALALHAQSTLQGVVADSEGGAIANAIVRIHWDPASPRLQARNVVTKQEDIVVQTAEDGSYSVNLAPGFYDIFVTSTAFEPAATKVRTLSGKTSTFSSKLKFSKIVCDEVCETIATPAR